MMEDLRQTGRQMFPSVTCMSFFSFILLLPALMKTVSKENFPYGSVKQTIWSIRLDTSMYSGFMNHMNPDTSWTAGSTVCS